MLYEFLISTALLCCSELGANLAGGNNEMDAGTSGVPSTNSGKSVSAMYRNSVKQELRKNIDSYDDENMMYAFLCNT